MQNVFELIDSFSIHNLLSEILEFFSQFEDRYSKSSRSKQRICNIIINIGSPEVPAPDLRNSKTNKIKTSHNPVKDCIA